ncbi:MAG TPA: glycosyltransferase [Flavisolibacter sp.]|nr:glycosyltransferase [Flavisolibacter sp.]
MPKAVRDIELTKLPVLIDNLHSYDGAFLLLRYHGRPVGRIILPTKNGQIILADHLKEIQEAVDKLLKHVITDHFLFSDEEEFQTKATIAVCTRNRAEDLKFCLDSLMKLPDRGQEIIVVDNDPSTDDTKSLIKQYPSVRYVLEKRKGLNIARNRAIVEASNDIVVFTDDDAMVDVRWLDKIVRHFDDPMTMCVTGMAMPFELETKAQEAFENYNPFWKSFYKIRFSFSKPHPLSTGKIGAGVNMALRKSIISKTGWFDEALDAGTPTQSGGDHEFFARIMLAGYHIIYDPEALSWHRHRRTWKEAVKAIHGYGIGVYAFWTKLFLIERQYSIIQFPKFWLLDTQLPNFYKSLFGINKYPLSFLLAELHGCLKGPFAYLKSRNQTKKYFKTKRNEYPGKSYYSNPQPFRVFKKDA